MLLTLFRTSPGFYVSACKKNNAGKGEIAHNKQFLLFPNCFLPFWRTLHNSHQIQNCRMQTVLVQTLKESKNFCLGKS